LEICIFQPSQQNRDVQNTEIGNELSASLTETSNFENSKLV